MLDSLHLIKPLMVLMPADPDHGSDCVLQYVFPRPDASEILAQFRFIKHSCRIPLWGI